MEQSIRTDPTRLRAFIEGHPVLTGIADADGSWSEIHLAGGAVRDLLIGREVVDIDLVVESGAIELALSLAPDPLIHERFQTAELVTGGIRVDIATARTESYAHPGSLPDVEMATVEQDLGRRDFTMNAMAVPLGSPEHLIDPHGGRQDLEAGVIRVLHPGSFVDDPTRAFRAARYSARFGFDLDPETKSLLLEADLATISNDRVGHEIELAAAEPTGIEAFRLISGWRIIEIDAARLELADQAVALLATEPWKGRAERPEVVTLAILGEAPELPARAPHSRYAAVVLARGLTAPELLVNRARGAEWLDECVGDWLEVRAAITGDDLVAAGLPQGPAIGVGLEAALKARLDDGVEGINAQLGIAVAAAEATLDAG